MQPISKANTQAQRTARTTAVTQRSTLPSKTAPSVSALRCVLALAVCVCSLLAAGASPALAGACPNESLRYGYGAHLPDCRAYEQATDVEKDGTNPQSAYNAVQAATNGGGITFFSQAGVPGADGAGTLPIFLARRTEKGWSTQGLLPPAKVGQFRSNVIGWTPSLTEAFGFETQLGPPVSVPLLMRDTSDRATQTIAAPAGATYAFADASADGRKVFFEAFKATLTPEAVAKKYNLYVWDRDTGAISLVDVLPSTACEAPPCTPPGGSFAGPYDWWNKEPANGGANSGYFVQAEHAISTDGQKAYFTAGETGQIYLREDPASPNATTLQVSASQKTNGTGAGGTDPNGPQPAAFLEATPDGSKAFFTSQEELTNDANTGSADEGSDLYRYEPASGTLTDLTPDPGDAQGAEVQGVLGASEDGSYVYFAANGDLDGSGPATQGDCVKSPEGGTGQCNLYLWHDGEIRFIAELDATGEITAERSDSANWVPTVAASGGGNNPYTGRVSGDGRALLFRSQSQLTSYKSGGTPQFYRYEAPTGQIDCVSCNPSGEPPVGRPALQTQMSALGAGGLAGIETRSLSASGNQVFFETPDPLVPEDSNGVTDVYEWEADGAGSCESAEDDGGCLYLLSTGTNPDASHFGDASASGDEAFLFTDQSLVGQDQDQLIDIYDARVDGGLESQNPEPATTCTGEECRSPLLAPPPATPFTASSTFSGEGNRTASKSASANLTTTRRTLKRTVRSDSFVIVVSAPAKGTITIFGAGVSEVNLSVAGSGSYHLRVQSSRSEKRLLSRRHRLKLVLRVRYAPATATSARSAK